MNHSDPPNLPHPAKSVLYPFSAWGHLQIFPVNYAKNVQVHTPPGYAYVECIITYIILSTVILPVDIVWYIHCNWCHTLICSSHVTWLNLEQSSQ